MSHPQMTVPRSFITEFGKAVIQFGGSKDQTLSLASTTSLAEEVAGLRGGQAEIGKLSVCSRATTEQDYTRYEIGS